MRPTPLTPCCRLAWSWALWIWAVAMPLGAASAPESNALLSRIPQTFPQPMTFKAFAQLRGDELQKTLNAASNFAFIHGFPSIPALRTAVLGHFSHSGKIITCQDAWGGINEESFTAVWPGHCLYKAGTLLSADLGAQDKTCQVAEPERLAKNQKSVEKANANFPLALILYSRDAAGRPDWSTAEHVVLTGLSGKQLTLKRAQWGTKARSFKAGQAAVAGHMMFWSHQWQLNYSAHCPRGGREGLNAAEWHARLMAAKVAEWGVDGIEFDVARWTWGFPEHQPMDIDNDLVADYGYLDGVNSFGLGGQTFLKTLRGLLGPDKIIQMDSNHPIWGQRGWQYVNGVQLESFPGENHPDQFSECFLHLRRWVENVTQQPALSYGFTKTATTTFCGVRAEGGASLDYQFRIGLASACLLGMPHPFLLLTATRFDPANAINEDTAERPGVYAWDEYHGGDLNDWRWLGRPLAPLVRDESDLTPTNLLAGAGWAWQVAPGFQAETLTEPGSHAVRVKGVPPLVIPKSRWFGICLSNVGAAPAIVSGRNYTLRFEARGDDAWDCAGQHFEKVPRLISLLGIARRRETSPVSVLADGAWRSYAIELWADSNTEPSPRFSVSEQVGMTALRNIELLPGSCERWRREFTGGVVLLNMSKAPWTAALSGRFRRLKGSQNPDIHRGEAVGERVTVPAWDALFLRREPAGR
ncbi:MAG: hypothetical protein J0L75_03195 [Spirochaetes bacterium]|nr:hypothetical protein [Spirochaetota bacterium]